MMTRSSNDIWIGAGLCLFSVLLLVYFIPEYVVTPKNVRNPVLSPQFWPEIIAYAILILGATTSLLGFFGNADSCKTDEPRNPHGLMRLLGVAGVLAGYYLLIPSLGMIWTSVLAYGTLAIIFSTRHRLAAALAAVILPIVLFAFFSHIAGVPIPQGQLVRLP